MIPVSMKAAVYRGRGKVVVESVPVPRIGAGEVLVKVAACGVCHTDLKKVEYGLQAPPRIYGHEMAGTIVAMGKGVRKWRVGDRVAVFHHIPCGKCFFCERADYAQCAVYKKTGSTAGFEPAGGGFAQYLRVLPWIVKNGMVRVPRSVPLENASFLEPVNTVLKAVDRLNIRKGDLVPVFGQGPIGLMFTQLLKVRGARPVGLDLISSRRKLSTRLGAAWSADPREPAFERRLRKETDGRGADGAVLAVPSEAALKQALAVLRPGGAVLLFAHTRRGEEVRVDAGAVCVDEKTVLGSYSSSIDVSDEVARLVFSGRVDVAPLITHRFPLDRVTEAFALASRPTPTSLKVLVTP
jgi:L-iditol 2-dehydrogenase